ncbi:uncharacterized protein JN550_013744 [Neoarthrinium moseri]|uniref:uncharacterized protein n=1 Tax=Neoarthrinium moseri TaxID=1658444 RepID=UPI001FDBCA9C|nr:uncharacterized protein JN550_013744 [Neoarthrinium moseri]KAI1856656.1 hypothetical protein JN550_013744 [Neoarthrinium moseri]
MGALHSTSWGAGTRQATAGHDVFPSALAAGTRLEGRPRVSGGWALALLALQAASIGCPGPRPRISRRPALSKHGEQVAAKPPELTAAPGAELRQAVLAWGLQPRLTAIAGTRTVRSYRDPSQQSTSDIPYNIERLFIWAISTHS